MHDSACDELHDNLVDYADGELDASAVSELTSHLAICADCRLQLAALRRSLSLAQQVWERSAAELEAQSNVRAIERKRRAFRPHRWAIAASLALLVVAWALLNNGEQRPVTETTAKTIAQLEYEIWEAGMAQQLLVVADMFVSVKGGDSYARDRWQTIVDDYPETEAAATARRRLNEAQERFTQ